ncbi:succinylglutamate desuccinylase/aspartoacylase family protein [Rhodohalobacter mucosus]|uniref:Aspartoacylase n=1 Tax=Rhodohalobacter mucosus TaxID=2079485 RepID=A0A316TUI4_9BACT|nr:succinylglutamate desuccinylase/aspartoacylase family protein [Rhodohalobacter mucosus]PWN08100.1 aspartoacylase [Rhodohalobacter mucosus]
MIKSSETDLPQATISKRVRSIGAGKPGYPVVVFFVGIHGNERAGVVAIQNILEEYMNSGIEPDGKIYVITGNLEALERGVRYVDTDLNRLWEKFNTDQDFTELAESGKSLPSEYFESLEIKSEIDNILHAHEQDRPDILFADLHTTSSESCAFILLNDTLANRELAQKFPVPQILGIEENIHGTLLSYINNLGCRAIGFEAGAHSSFESIERSKAFIRLLLHHIGLVKAGYPDLEQYEIEMVDNSGMPNSYYEIRYHHYIEDINNFNMYPGYRNFDTVEKGEPLAIDEGEVIKAPEEGRIFMPLYQKSGNDGFLIIREVSPFWLTFSAWLRDSSIHSLLAYLPGVTRSDKQEFIVNLDIALFFVKEIFHLLGYRVTEKDRSTLICYRR